MRKKFIVMIIVLSMVLVIGVCVPKEKYPNNDNINSENSSESQINNESTTAENPEDKLTDEEKAQLEYDKLVKEREELEIIRKTELGEFYVPLPGIDDNKQAEKINAKGLFLTGSTAGKSVNKDNVDLYIEYINALKNKDTETINRISPNLINFNTLEKIIGIAAATEINAVVIDVKDDSGYMTFKSNIKAVQEVGGDKYVRISDVKSLIKLLEDYDIYPIARIVTFKDKNYANAKPEHSIQLLNGGVWIDYSGTPWVNPFNKNVWDYNLSIAREAALAGFKEIQFDYVRFPDNAVAYNSITEFPGRDGRQKDDAIGDFLEYIKKGLEGYNVNIGADVFGLITRTWDDYPEDIGQSWINMSPFVDYMCPMVYPSHYGPQWYGYEVPDAHPYGVVRGVMMEAIEKTSAVSNGAAIRPWIQDFTATWVTGYIYYGYNEVRQQIIAAKELGIDEYMVWNPSNVYDPRSFFISEKEVGIKYPVDTGDYDLVGRTPGTAMYEYFKNERHSIFSKVFLLTALDNRVTDFEIFYNQMTNDKYELIDYDVLVYKILSKDNAEVTVDYKYKIIGNNEETFLEAKNSVWKLIKENGVWKIYRNLE